MTSASKPNSVICYVSDANFALPSLISAIGARRWVPKAMADIFLLTISVSDIQFAQLTEIADSHQIHVVEMEADRLQGFDSSNVHKTHVPLSTLGRLFLHEFIPSKYECLLYVDGDTWITGDITPLVAFRPPENIICAAEDPSFFYRHDIGSTGRRVRAYFAGLGIDGDQGYFNAGVVVSRLNTWREIAREAFEFFCTNVDRCLFHDQSALNAVAQNRRLKLSSKWDFMTDFMFWDVESVIAPRIFHFTGFPKPWMGPFFPWSDMSVKYSAAFDALQATSFPAGRLDERFLAQVETGNKRISRRLATVLRHRRYARSREMGEIEAHAVI